MLETKYVRLMTYKEAEKVIDFVNINSENYACITAGGIMIQIETDMFSWEYIENYVKKVASRYEFVNEHPSKVEQKIVESYKN